MRYHPRSPKARSMFLFHGAGPKIVRHVLFGAWPEIMRFSPVFFSAWLAGALCVFSHAECRVRRRVVCCMYFSWRAAPRIVRHALLGVGREGACVVCVSLRVAYRRVTCFPCRLVRRRVVCFPPARGQKVRGMFSRRVAEGVLVGCPGRVAEPWASFYVFPMRVIRGAWHVFPWRIGLGRVL